MKRYQSIAVKTLRRYLRRGEDSNELPSNDEIPTPPGKSWVGNDGHLRNLADLIANAIDNASVGMNERT